MSVKKLTLAEVLAEAQAESLDALLDLLKQGDKLVLEHGGFAALTTFGVLRAIGRDAVLDVLLDEGHE